MSDAFRQDDDAAASVPQQAAAARQYGLIDRIMGEMPAWQKSILTFVLIVPLVLSMSGIMLQLNIGSILTRYIDYLYESSKKQTADIDKLVAAHIAESTQVLRDDLAAQRTEMSVAIAEIRASLDGRVMTLEEKVGKIEHYICDTDKALGYGACSLDSDIALPKH